MKASNFSNPCSSPRSGPARYDPIAMSLHWVLAVAILAGLGSGLYAASLPFSPARLMWVNWHKWMGISVLFASALRLLWRVRHAPPPLPEGVHRRMRRWQRRAYKAVHGTLYTLFFAVPLAGWAYSSAAGVSIVWLGILPLPDFAPADQELAAHLRTLHGLLAWGLGLLAMLHVAAVCRHAFDRDGVIQRMLPDWGRRS